MPTMPNLVGLQLSSVQLTLQTAGVLDPNSIGYFGTWPITVTAKPNAAVKGTVTSQTPLSGSSVAINPAIALTVSDLPLGMVYP